MFVDRAEITIKAGDGGNGCCSFRREAFIPKGGPNGGDGAPGGNVIFVGDPGELSLMNFVFNRRFIAQNGGDGKGKDMHGRKGKDLSIKVPLGTLVYNQETDDLLADIDEAGKEVVVAVGGRGGKGNARFATSTNRAPREHEPGEKIEPLEIRMELKMVADIGLVGYPNAGKSTFLGAVSNAKPKVAPYPFTTLHPVIGIMEYPDFKRISIADIPGLIDGAHLNVGLGHYFLRHIERTKMLIYVLDMAAVDGRKPVEDLKILMNELEEYMEGLSERAGIILANKMDLPESQENLEELQLEAPENLEIIPLSAATDQDFSVSRNGSASGWKNGSNRKNAGTNTASDGKEREPVELNGKRILVTGGAIRVGAELCRAFASHGAKIVLHYHTSGKEAACLLKELGGSEAGHCVYCCNLANPEEAYRMVTNLKTLDVLVNNASVYLRKTLPEESFAESERQFNINVHSPVEMIKAFARLERSGEGAVINMLDQAITATDSSSFSYALSKKMLAEATRAAALQYAPAIRINGIAPGPVLAPKGLEHLNMQKTLPTLPLKRPVALNDLTEAAIFLSRNSSITGEILFVDCGQSL